MAVEVIMPALGVAQDTGLLVTWFHQEGDTVTQGEPLMIVETDKSTMELEAPGSGTLVQVTAAEGEQPPLPAADTSAPAGGGNAPAATPSTPVAGGGTAPADDGVARPPGRAPAVPKVRRLAAERGIDLATIVGTGPGGAITVNDLDAASAVSAGPGDTSDDDGAGARRAAVWQAMAGNVTASWQQVPHFYLDRVVPAGKLLAAREAVGRPATISDLLVAAVAASLREHPLMNAGRADVNVGLATAADDGLFVPVIRHAGTLELADITARRIELLEKLRSGRQTPDDFADPTFTISNLGMFGVDSFHAIVSAGQAGILSVGRIHDQVIAQGDGFSVAPVMSVALSCDHRLIDGMHAAKFLSALAAALEAPPGSGD